MKKEAYTPDEVAKLFKISKHTVYELVKRGELQAFKVSNKMRFEQDEVLRFKEAGKTHCSAIKQSTHTLTITGSHDFLIESLIKYVSSQPNILSLQPTYIGSLEGLMMLHRGACDIAAIHLLDPTSQEYNLPFIKQLFVHEPITVIRIASREQGLIVAKDNPKQITQLGDLTRDDITFVNRQKGSGTRFLLDLSLSKEGIDPGKIEGYHDEEWTHLDTAVKIQQNFADVGMGIRPAATKLGLDFIPLANEQFDFVLRWTDRNNVALQHLIDLIQLTSFKDSLTGIEGYNTEEFGKIIYTTN